MKYLQDQRKKLRDGIKQFEQGQKLLLQQNLRIMEEEKENDRLRASKQPQVFSYKDTEIKTFYMGNVQQKYKVADQPFPERSTFTINIKDERIVNDNYNSESNINTNYNNIHNSLCPGCGRMTTSHIKNSTYNYLKVDNSCPGCGRMLLNKV